MKTIITITIENPSDEVIKSLLEGAAEKQTAVIKTGIKVDKPKKLTNSLKGKKPVVKSGKKCIDCGKGFDPHSNRQLKCDDCRDIKSVKKHPIEPIEKTMEEIQRNQAERESQPYNFTPAGYKKRTEKPEAPIRKPRSLDMNL